MYCEYSVISRYYNLIYWDNVQIRVIILYWNLSPCTTRPVHKRFEASSSNRKKWFVEVNNLKKIESERCMLLNKYKDFSSMKRKLRLQFQLKLTKNRNKQFSSRRVRYRDYGHRGVMILQTLHTYHHICTCEYYSMTWLNNTLTS